MYRIDYEMNESRLFIDARDFITLLVALPSFDGVDKKSVNLVEKIVSSLIATSEEIDSAYLSVTEDDIKKMKDELIKKDLEVVKSQEKEMKKNKAVNNNTKE